MVVLRDQSWGPAIAADEAHNPVPNSYEFGYGIEDDPFGQIHETNRGAARLELN